MTICMCLLAAGAFAQETARIRPGTPIRWSQGGSVPIGDPTFHNRYGQVDSTARRNRGSLQTAAAVGGQPHTRIRAVQARCDGNSITFRWTALQLTSQTDRYYIEQSTNERNWEAVGTVPAHRYSTGNEDYSFTLNRNVQNAFFRITAVNSDSDRVASNVLQAPCNSELNLEVNPNPVYSTATVRLGAQAAGRVQLSLVNASGVVVWQRESGVSAGPNQIPLDMSSLGRGVYSLAIRWSNGRVETMQVIKQ
ncbi:MAG TPA: T9SS type A sorting domain-containing protein [Chitinophagaceae bacterium]|nr:T9SS type A sorting domain-containing protein [Chitinophagaceae bacterium]